MRILLVEDDIKTAGFVERGFREHGHLVEVARDGLEAVMLASDGAFDVLVVDRMLPRLDGLSLVRNLRAAGVRTPVIFLSAMGALEDRIAGLDAGADDYLVKPFAFAELYARVMALARRPPMREVQVELRAGDLVFNRLRREVTRGGKEIALLPTELRLLEVLLENAGRVVTRTMLLERVWDFHFDPKTNIVESHISRLRAKVDRGYERERIRTIRGAGYMVDDAP